MRFPHIFQGDILVSLCIALLSFPLTGFAAEPIIAGLTGSHDMEPTFAGRVLLSELNCTSCHQGDVASKGGPDLDQVGQRVHPDYLKKFILAPHVTKPGTTMPNMLGHLSEEDRNTEAGAISDYLVSKASAPFTLQAIDEGRIKSGRDLYHKVGCVACHSPEDKVLPNSPSLDGMQKKYSLKSLTSFLENPLEVRPGGRMPDMNLTHWEALDIASYLLRNQKLESLEITGPKRATSGEALFVKHGCAQCHQPVAAKSNYAKALDKLDPSTSCSGANFSLSDTQQKQISAALRKFKEQPDRENNIHLTLTRLNCFACHQRGQNGGPDGERDEYFTTTNLNLGEQARIPPSLTGVGGKLNQSWLRKVLFSGAAARPYINTRMPKFGIVNVEHLLVDFAKVDTLEKSELEGVKDQKVARESGHNLVGDKNLSCVACHTWKGQSATTLSGLELTSMTERLQENWFHHYMRNPQQFHPTTIMPGFWPGGKSVRPNLFEGDPGKQIDSIWQYLSRGKEARTPSGIRREPIEYRSVNGEAVMLRRQYNGIGKRGIGVGYPAGMNLSFDAGQMRLGSIWKGDFGEMSGVWRGQGSGNVNEGTRDIVRFPVGPAFARLESVESDWPVLEKGQKAEGFQFRGYSLDGKQRPTFRYTYAGVTITDHILDAPGKLIRTLSFNKPMPGNTYFRAATDRELKQGSRKGSFELPRGLVIELDGKGITRSKEGVQEVVLPLEGETSVTIKYLFQEK